MRKLPLGALLTLSALLSGAAALAQDAAPAAAPAADAAQKAAEAGSDLTAMLWLMGGLTVLIIFVLLMLFALLWQMRPLLREVYAIETIRESWYGRALGLFLGDTVGLTGKYKVDVMAGHDYDGITEYDNDLPPWWKYGFYLTIVFGVAYFIHFHVTQDGQLSEAEYQHEMAEAALMAAKMGANDDPNKPTDYKPLTAAADVDAGKTIFAQNCAACHGQSAEGKVGPNLTDEYWLHGGEVNKVYHTVKYGVQGKGMVAWKGKLSSKQMLQVASYILTLQGSNPANAKAPQGEKEAAGKPVAKL
ncbi:c-type cytochrome [Hymenobacter sp. 15J16-1T3B]|uniref:cbb3-type cytochrome c oxidase N-terminal domain-containing protein n=1 Tax=Hymenobacter sp. 15J16-1T3B TaxID=2886941 RepID=UPI001D10601C|nr:cbb3-type cytochrome c oxidase N-terminal domain-containing protein [Hymenobacter sp. 15J16-1T3B]MCC3159160.1 c-type cytochrome [Hymenobacter sp. 15J16-1T3B]